MPQKLLVATLALTALFTAIAAHAAFEPLVSTSIPVTPEALGDLTEDGVIDLRDLLRVQEIVAGQGAAPTGYESAEADMDGSGSVDSNDLQILELVLLAEQGAPARLDPTTGGTVSGGGVSLNFGTRDLASPVQMEVQPVVAADLEANLEFDFGDIEADSSYFMTAFDVQASSDDYVYPPAMDIELPLRPPCELQGSNMLMAARIGPRGTTEFTMLTELEIQADSTLASPAPPHPSIALSPSKTGPYEPLQTIAIEADNVSAQVDGNRFWFTQDHSSWHPVRPVGALPDTASSVDEITHLVVPVPWLDAGPTFVVYEHLGTGLRSSELTIQIAPLHAPSSDPEPIITEVFAEFDLFWNGLADAPVYQTLGLIESYDRRLDVASRFAAQFAVVGDSLLGTTPSVQSDFAAVIENIGGGSAVAETRAHFTGSSLDDIRAIRNAYLLFSVFAGETYGYRDPDNHGLTPSGARKLRRREEVIAAPDPELCRPDDLQDLTGGASQQKSFWRPYAKRGAPTLGRAIDPSYLPRQYPGLCMNIWRHNTNGGGSVSPPCNPSGASGSPQPPAVHRASTGPVAPDWLPYDKHPLTGAVVTPEPLGVAGIVGVIDGAGAFAIPGLDPGTEIRFSIYDPKTGLFDPDAGGAVSPNVVEQGAWFDVDLFFDPLDTETLTTLQIGDFVEASVESNDAIVHRFTLAVNETMLGQRVNVAMAATTPKLFRISSPSGVLLREDLESLCGQEYGLLLEETGFYEFFVTFSDPTSGTINFGPFSIGVSADGEYPINWLCGDIRGSLVAERSPYRAIADAAIQDTVRVALDSGVSIDVDIDAALVNHGVLAMPDFAASTLRSGVLRNFGTIDVASDSVVIGPDVILEESGLLTADDRVTFLRVEGTLSHARYIFAVADASVPAAGLQVAANQLVIAPSGSIDVTGKGYRGHGTDGWNIGGGETYPGDTIGSRGSAGGSYGGRGGNSVDGSGDSGLVYGEPKAVALLGSGGAHSRSGGDGGSGGGAITIEVDDLTVLGSIVSDGAPGVGNIGSGGGSGGAIRLFSPTISGDGVIRASGGTTSGSAGGGGGGRILIVTDTTDLSELTIDASGGVGTSGRNGGAGTIVQIGPAFGVNGALTVDNFDLSGQNFTTLTGTDIAYDSVAILGGADVSVGTASAGLEVTAPVVIDGAGNRLFFTNGSSFTASSLSVMNGGEVDFAQSMSVSLGALAIDRGGIFRTGTSLSFAADGDFTLSGIASSVTNEEGAVFSLPRFDSASVGGGTFENFGTLEVASDSVVVAPNVTLMESGLLSADDRVAYLEVGGIVTHLRYGLARSMLSNPELGLQLTADRVLVNATGSINVTGKGYRGHGTDGWNIGGGETYPGDTIGSRGSAGGSYGGRGGNSVDGSGISGPTYGDSQLAVLYGSGGAHSRSGGDGGSGGGAITIEVDELTVLGSILSNGAPGVGNIGSGGGSGGAIRVIAPIVTGDGVIRASGGTTSGSAGGGGGGRIVLLTNTTDLSALLIEAPGGAGAATGEPGSVVTDVVPALRTRR